MKKIILLAFVLLLLLVQANAQIGLLETNSALKSKDTIVRLPFEARLNYYEDVIRKYRVDFENSPWIIEISSRDSTAQKYFFAYVTGKWDSLSVSIRDLKRDVMALAKECTSTDYKMWNYFTRFEDSNQVVVDYVMLVDSLSEAYGNFDTLLKVIEEYKKEIRSVERDYLSIRDSVEQWRKSGLPVNLIPNKDNVFHSLINKVQDNCRQYQSRIKSGFDTLRVHQEVYNRIIEFFFKKKQSKKPEEKSFGALPQVTSVIGERETVPGIQLLGKKNFGTSEKDFLTGEMGLLLGMQSSPDRPNLKTLFVDEASSFHLYTYFNYGFGAVNTKHNNQKRLAINLHISYSVKKILTDTLETTKIITPSLFHTQTGIELAIFVNALSVYSNVNTLTILDKVKEFKAGLNVVRNFYGYVDCGAKIFLDPEPALGIKNAKLFVNANFIVNSGDVKYVTQSEDVVIPNIQLGIKATF